MPTGASSLRNCDSMDVKITSGMAIFFFVLILVVKGNIEENALSAATSGISIAAFLRFAFVKWIWKWRWLRWLERFHGVPYLEGNWTGQFDSSGNTRTPADRLTGAVKVVIAQPDIRSIRIMRTSDESRSTSLGESISISDDGTGCLLYSYLSEPAGNVRDRSNISYGSAKLIFDRKNPTKLWGNYWTDQQTQGLFEIKKLRK